MTLRFVTASQNTIPDCFIVDRGPGAPVLVAIHGISRNAAEIASRFAADARFAAFTICAPLFEKNRFGQYQQLIAKRGCIPSDLALIDLLGVLARTLQAKTDKISLFGFSGGAQMAHRFAILHPTRVAQAFVASAGWYLMPDTQLRYPYGLAEDVRFEPLSDRVLSVPITVAVGSEDVRIDATVRQCELIDMTQGETRVARAQSWVAAMQRFAADRNVASRVAFVSLPGGTHDFAQCVRDSGLIDAVAEAFFDRNASDMKHA